MVHEQHLLTLAFGYVSICFGCFGVVCFRMHLTYTVKLCTLLTIDRVKGLESEEVLTQ